MLENNQKYLPQVFFIWKADLLHYIQGGGVDQDPAGTQLICRGALQLPVRHHQHVGGESH